MDEQALGEQAAFLGTTSFELAQRYRQAGLNGIALYEETFDTLAAEGDIAILSGNAARSEEVLTENNVNVPPNSLLVTNLKEGRFSSDVRQEHAATAGGHAW